MGERAEADDLRRPAEGLIVGGDAGPEAVADEHHPPEAAGSGKLERRIEVVGRLVKQAAAVNHPEVGHPGVDREGGIAVVSQFEGEPAGHAPHEVAERAVDDDRQGVGSAPKILPRPHQEAVPVLVVGRPQDDQLDLGVEIVMAKLGVGPAAGPHGHPIGGQGSS
jgi:hypothetical protein